MSVSVINAQWVTPTEKHFIFSNSSSFWRLLFIYYRKDIIWKCLTYNHLNYVEKYFNGTYNIISYSNELVAAGEL